MFVMYVITRVNITSTNLNLFVAFDALITHGSVSRAARSIGITQSALSNALRNLRGVFGDPLFLRTAHGMRATPRARALAAPVREALRLLDQALDPASFDPATAQRTFRLMTSDYVEFVLLPRLLQHLGKHAPGVRIQVLPWGQHRVPDELARGGAELAIGYFDKLPPHHHERGLFEERYVCIVRKRHPVVRDKLTLRTYVQLGHVMVTQNAEAAAATPSGQPNPGLTSGIDRALAALGHSRDVQVRVSHFLNVPPLIASTDLVAALSRRIAEPFARMLPLRLFEPPLKLRHSRIAMAWHASLAEDPAQRWLRDQVATVAAAV